MNKCSGCGVTFQYEDSSKIGYSPKKDVSLCQRCFKLKHYGKNMISMKTSIDPDTIFKNIADTDGEILWIVDAFDFESSLITGINKKIFKRKLVMVLTKLDLLKDIVSKDNLIDFVYERLKFHGIKIDYLILNDYDSTRILSILKDIGDRFIVVGRANSGKSSFINMILNDKTLVESRYPGTTLDFNICSIDDILIIDTPGIEPYRSMLLSIDEDDLSILLPKNKIKAKVYQCYESLSFFIGGLLRIDICSDADYSVVFYISESLNIHRTKIIKGDSFQEKRGSLFKPFVDENIKSINFIKKDDKMDVVFYGLGWLCISGSVKEVKVYHTESQEVISRKAFI